jgi:hypothetical protein
MTLGRLDKVRIIFNLGSVLEPVGDLGLRITLGRMAAKFSLTAELDLLRIRRGVELFAKVWR